MQCVECDEAIVNPVCPDCLSEGVAAWVGERLGPTVASAVFDVTAALAYPGGSTWCIKCASPMKVCAHCYTDELMTILRHHPVVLAQFVFYFGFEDAPRRRSALAI